MTNKALILVDVQNDFCPGGSLAVTDGDQVVEPLNWMIEEAKKNDWVIVATRDWHPEDTTVHFDTWPAHCVQGTTGAMFHNDLNSEDAVIFTKGADPEEDAYSGFQAKAIGLKLGEYLRARGVDTIYVGGLATDYCVKATVLDGIKEGFRVVILSNAIKAVNVNPDDGANAFLEMEDSGAVPTMTWNYQYEV